ncbi:MAG: hypothetical protein ISS66_18795 [Desulfobacteraceae bacterium]|nr:hypothetical protein [Desulfobacteraceae bacterium]
MTIFYLDTSTINRIFDSPYTDSLSKVIQKNVIVYPSVLNIAELGAESDEVRRVGLLKLTKEISGNYRPLAMPSDLLKRSLECLQVWAKDMDHSMDTKWDGIWVALNDPSRIDERAYQEIIEWKAQQEKWFQDMHNRGRPAMQEAINRMSKNQKNSFTSSFSKMIKFYPPEGEFVKTTVSDLASRSGVDIEISDEFVERVINHSEHWRFFLTSMAYGLYSRSVKPTHFSKKRNPGSIDTQQAVYLVACDIFVTDDIQQHRMLRLLMTFGHKKRKIYSYTEFEANLRFQT